jgi:hypothetical protein
LKSNRTDGAGKFSRLRDEPVFPDKDDAIEKDSEIPRRRNSRRNVVFYLMRLRMLMST